MCTSSRVSRAKRQTTVRVTGPPPPAVGPYYGTCFMWTFLSLEFGSLPTVSESLCTLLMPEKVQTKILQSPRFKLWILQFYVQNKGTTQILCVSLMIFSVFFFQVQVSRSGAVCVRSDVSEEPAVCIIRVTEFSSTRLFTRSETRDRKFLRNVKTSNLYVARTHEVINHGPHLVTIRP